MNMLGSKYVLKSTTFIKVLQSDAKYDDLSLCLLKQHFIMGRKLWKGNHLTSTFRQIGTKPLIKILLTITDSLIQNNSLSINGVNQYNCIHDDVLLWACAGCADAEVITPPTRV